MPVASYEIAYKLAFLFRLGLTTVSLRFARHRRVAILLLIILSSRAKRAVRFAMYCLNIGVYVRHAVMARKINRQSHAHYDNDRLQNAQIPAQENKHSDRIRDAKRYRDDGEQRNKNVSGRKQQNDECNGHRGHQRRVRACNELILEIVQGERDANKPCALEAVGRLSKLFLVKLLEIEIVIAHGFVVDERSIGVDAE